jgi:archaellum biogenesis ATPase FlaH
MVQQISYAQEIEELMEQQEVTATSSQKTLHSFINQEGILRVEG